MDWPKGKEDQHNRQDLVPSADAPRDTTYHASSPLPGPVKEELAALGIRLCLY